MGQLEDIALFARIVETGSISKAAEQLNLAKSAVSRRLSELENRLGVQLLVRSTRTSKLTEAGRLYYTQSQAILDQVTELNEQASGHNQRLSGTLILSAPLSFGLMHLSPLMHEYATAHEELGFQVDFTDRHVDLIEEGIELAIRIGQLPDSSLQAKRITDIRHVVCASPDYVSKFGAPNTPADLMQHRFLHYGLLKETKLVFSEYSGRKHTVSLKAKITSNNGDFLKSMALQGHGVTYLPTFMTYQELTSGKLIALLTDYQLPSMNAYAIYPRNRFLPQRCRRFIDFITERLGEAPYWDQPYHT